MSDVTPNDLVLHATFRNFEMKLVVDLVKPRPDGELRALLRSWLDIAMHSAAIQLHDDRPSPPEPEGGL